MNDKFGTDLIIFACKASLIDLPLCLLHLTVYISSMVYLYHNYFGSTAYSKAQIPQLPVPASDFCTSVFCKNEMLEVGWKEHRQSCWVRHWVCNLKSVTQISSTLSVFSVGICRLGAKQLIV